MFYLSLDVEASGPFPGLYSLVSLGAVAVVSQGNAWRTLSESEFYVELQPLEGAGELAEATAVHGLTADYLRKNGLEPALAMERFAHYHGAQQKLYGRAVGAAWPSSFDLPYVGWYCQRFLGKNPLGHSGFDLASYAMGLFGCARRSLRQAMKRAGLPSVLNPNPHHALADAVEQGTLLAHLLNYAQGRAAQNENGFRI